MMIKANMLGEMVAKVATAVGKDDTMRISFGSRDGVNRGELCAYDGAGLEFQQGFLYEGEAEANGSYIVKASQFVKTLELYKTLGVDTITLEAVEGGIVLKDGSGSTTIGLLENMASIDVKTLTEGGIGNVVFPLKGLQEVLRSATSVSGPDCQALYGYYFEADVEAGKYTMYCSDQSTGVMHSFTAAFKAVPGTEASSENFSFFVMPQFAKAISALKGENINAVITSNYVIVKDAENTLVIIRRNMAKFPLSTLKGVLIKKGEETEKVKSYALITVGVDSLLAVNDLCTLTTTDKLKIVKFNFEKEFIVSADSNKSARKLPGAKVEVTNPEILERSFLASTLRAGLRYVSTDKVTIKITNGMILMYNDGSDVPVAFIAPRKSA